jgi:hypothetical protein
MASLRHSVEFRYEDPFMVYLYINYGRLMEPLLEAALRYTNEAVYALFSNSLMKTSLNLSKKLNIFYERPIQVPQKMLSSTDISADEVRAGELIVKRTRNRKRRQ